MPLLFIFNNSVYEQSNLIPIPISELVFFFFLMAQISMAQTAQVPSQFLLHYHFLTDT